MVVAPACAVLLVKIIPAVSRAAVSPLIVPLVLPAMVEVLAANRPSKVFATGVMVADELRAFAVIEPTWVEITGWVSA